MAKLFSTIILLGALQGFIVSSLLFVIKKNRKSNRVLAFLILVITLASFKLYGNYADWFGSPILRFLAQIIPLVMPMAIGPLIYLYVQSILEPEFKITKKQRRHFYPLLIDFIPSITVFIYGIGLLLKLVNNNPAPWGNFIDTFNVYADIPRWMSITIYVWLSAKYLSAYKLKHNGALNGHSVNFKWLSQFIRVFMVFQAIWLVYLIPYVIPRYTDWMLNTFDWYPIYLPMAVIIYWLGIKGYVMSQRQIISDKKSSSNTALSADLVEQVIASLTKTMDVGKAYLNPSLNLAIMAETTSFAQRVISTVLNQHMQISFNDYVNGYRVNECKKRMGQPDMNNLTIAGVALECGFSSQATFQRVFKASTGLTPKEYISKKAQTGENNAQIVF